MKRNNILLPILVVCLFTACIQQEDATTNKKETTKSENEEKLHLSDLKFNAIGFQLAAIPYRFLENVVMANGELEVPPQHEASVTAVIGGNVESIKVIEGDKINKGQLLAYLKHPDLIKIQTAYQSAYHQFQLAEKEYQRQKSLFEEEVGAGKNYEMSFSAYQNAKGELKGLEAQLKQLNLPTSPIQKGEIFEKVAIKSPIDGYVEKVLVKIAQYVSPQTTLFEIVNTEHVHADLMVFEKDAHKIKKGQNIRFMVQSAPHVEMKAKIYSVGKRLEKDIKAVHLHAEITDNHAVLLPGMYIKGEIIVSQDSVLALREGAVVEENGLSYIFEGQKGTAADSTEWAFTLIEVKTGMTVDGWTEIIPMSPIEEKQNIVQNNAYDLISEMNKSKNTHSH